MNKMIRSLMAMCLLAVSLSAFAQSGDAMKQDDSMKQGRSVLPEPPCLQPETGRIHAKCFAG